MIKTMSIFHNIRLKFRPPKIIDPEFGQIRFMYISRYPERSYWEGEWMFSPTGTYISIGLPGDESGPLQESRQWARGLVNRYPIILERARSQLDEVYRSWFHHELPSDIFTVMKLSGFDVEDPRAFPVEWNISFETISDRWLGITIPFIGDEPKDAIVDT
jgi:hypothetical protein